MPISRLTLIVIIFSQFRSGTRDLRSGLGAQLLHSHLNCNNRGEAEVAVVEGSSDRFKA
jgi:hypothetical protein